MMYMMSSIKVPITTFRKDLFKLVDQALAGHKLEFVHKGVRFKVIPEGSPPKVSRLTSQRVFKPGRKHKDLETASRGLLAEMQREWEKDWSEL